MIELTNDLKSEFSIAYVSAIAHAGGYFVQLPNRMRDGDGVDIEIFQRGGGGVVRGPRLDLQLKATAKVPETDPFFIDLPLKNYTELISVDHQVPRILVVMQVPEDRADWATASPEQLVLRQCAWWLSLRGANDSQNDATQRVWVAKKNVFSMTALEAIMTKIRLGGFP
ncbi:MAG: DUF4365 domain-containing protein [Archangiaceae bacterium]|nr:DUF4365 domain-containing protein [Archangiaceae bacterium]